MKRKILILLFLLPAVLSWGATKLTRQYVQRPLPEVLIDIDRAAKEIHISFIYDKLEDYTVTCSFADATPIEAIHHAIGFYPVRVTQNGSNVMVEPIFDTEHKMIGRVVDERGEPLEFANVALLSLADSSIIGGGVTNTSGHFVIPCNEERVLLRASFIGYHTAQHECQVGNVGIVSLEEDAIALAEVSKSGTRPLARMERGMLVYDMPYLLSLLPADDAYEALSRIPGVIEVNGHMEFAGQEVTLVINGKATTMDAEQVKERLKQMPTDRLSKCEVMMSAPARYHTRGAVINIVTKDLYGQSHLSGQLRGTGTFSKRTKGMGTASLLFAHGKCSLDANYSFTGGSSYGKVTHDVQQTLTTGTWLYHDVTRGYTRPTVHLLYTQMEYAFAPKHRLSLTYNGKRAEGRQHNIATGTKPSEQRSTTHSYIDNVDANYTTPFGLQLGASYMHFRYPQEQRLDNSEGVTSQPGRERSDNTVQSDRQSLTSKSGQNIDKWDFTADQTHTLSHDCTLSYGAEMKLTKHESWQDTYLASGRPVDEATGHVGYTERISSLYASLGNQWSKVSTEIGAQAENYHTPQWDEWRVYPTLNLLWKATPKNELNLSFSSNSTYPSYWSQMNSVYYSTSYSEIWGNPDLKPMNSYVLSLMWRFRQRYTLSAVYQWDDNYIVQLPYQPSDRLAVVMQEINFDRSRQQLGFVGTAQWKAGRWAYGSVGAMYGFFRDRCDHFHDIPFDRTKWTGRVYATAAFRPFAKQNLTLMVQPLFQSRTIQGVYDIHQFFHLSASLRWTDKSGRLSATLAGNNLTNFHFQTTDTWMGQNFAMTAWQDWTNVQLTLTYRIAGYKDRQRKQMDTSRMGH